MAVAPSRIQVVVQKFRHLPREPGRHVDTVRDRANGPLVVRDPGPDRPPHLARDPPVHLADGIGRACGPQRQRGHVEQRPAAVVVMAEGQERVAVCAERAPRIGEVRFHEVERKGIVAGWHRGVGGEDRRPAHLVERGLE